MGGFSRMRMIFKYNIEREKMNKRKELIAILSDFFPSINTSSQNGIISMAILAEKQGLITSFERKEIREYALIFFPTEYCPV